MSSCCTFMGAPVSSKHDRYVCGRCAIRCPNRSSPPLHRSTPNYLTNPQPTLLSAASRPTLRCCLFLNVAAGEETADWSLQNQSAREFDGLRLAVVLWSGDLGAKPVQYLVGKLLPDLGAFLILPGLGVSNATRLSGWIGKSGRIGKPFSPCGR